MKVKILSHYDRIGEIVKAKKFSELTVEEIEKSIGYPDRWQKDDIFIHVEGKEWLYMLNSEVEIVDE